MEKIRILTNKAIIKRITKETLILGVEDTDLHHTGTIVKAGKEFLESFDCNEGDTVIYDKVVEPITINKTEYDFIMNHNVKYVITK